MRARDDDLPGCVVVGSPDTRQRSERLTNHLRVQAEDGGHSSRSTRGGLAHESPALADEPEPVINGVRTGHRKCNKLPETVACHICRDSVLENYRGPCNVGDVEKGLGDAGVRKCGIRTVGGDLAQGQPRERFGGL